MDEDITARFDPIEVDESGQTAIAAIRGRFKDLALVIEASTTKSRAQSIAFTELESAARAAIRAVAEANRA